MLSDPAPPGEGLHPRLHKAPTQPVARGAPAQTVGDPVKPPEGAFSLFRGQPDAVVADRQPNVLAIGRANDLNGRVRFPAGVLNHVVQQVTQDQVESSRVDVPACALVDVEPQA